MMHPSAALLTIAALLCTAAPPPFTGAGPDKLDAPVREALAAGGRIPVLVLCRDQLLLGPGAFEAFAREHANRARRNARQGAARPVARDDPGEPGPRDVDGRDRRARCWAPRPGCARRCA